MPLVYEELCKLAAQRLQGESAVRVWRLELLRERLREMELDW